MFTSIDPYRLRITGRTKHFMNAFGEEVVIDNAIKAIKIACDNTNAVINEWTAAPSYLRENQNGFHEWLIEFDREPNDLNSFRAFLDDALKSLNSDYEAKRFNNMILGMPIVRSVPKGTFYKWLKSKNKLGGQHKVPRLNNDRKYVEGVLYFSKS
jgi:hypothetical protein